ncbi:hypothetical protein CAPTEDRAFT_48121, partial [Capitella teleta]
WKIYTAVCLERTPVVTAEKTSIEKEFTEYLNKVEFENSLLSDHEIRHKEDLTLAERKKAEDYEETEAEAQRQTAMDMEDLWEKELAESSFASRITAADKSGDLKTTDRCLDRKLVLVVKQQVAPGHQHWVLPKSQLLEGETLRQGAERTLSSLCGSALVASFMGNAPVGYQETPF